MARKPMVTRTIITTKVNALCLDVVKCEPCNIEVVLPRTYKNDEKLLKVAKEIAETDSLKLVQIVDKEEVETLYGMSEADFIKYSVVLDPETRKALEADEAEDEE